MSDEQQVQSLISCFECKYDPDIVNFLRNRAILFEKVGKSRTFILYDESNEEEFNILGFFSLALQVLKIPEGFSNRRIKELDGFNAKVSGEVIEELPTILIGQLAKNDTFKHALSGDDLMTCCLETILSGQQFLAGRIVMLECKDVPYLKEFYKGYGFHMLEDEYDPGDLHQFIRIIPEQEIIAREENKREFK